MKSFTSPSLSPFSVEMLRSSACFLVFNFFRHFPYSSVILPLHLPDLLLLSLCVSYKATQMGFQCKSWLLSNSFITIFLNCFSFLLFHLIHSVIPSCNYWSVYCLVTIVRFLFLLLLFPLPSFLKCYMFQSNSLCSIVNRILKDYILKKCIYEFLLPPSCNIKLVMLAV